MEKVISKDGTVIAFDRTGTGPLLVLIQGAMIYRNFPPNLKLAEALSKKFTVINYDRRGRGDSSDTQPYSPQREIEDLHALVSYLGESPYAFGMSSGAALAIHAITNGVNVQKLALYEPPFVATNLEEQQDALAFLSEVKNLLAQDRRADAMKAFMKKVGVPGFVRLIMPLMPFWKHGLKVAHTLPYDLTILSDQTVPKDLLAKIQIPTLVMSGEATAPKLKVAAEATARALTNATYKALAKQAHNVSPQVLATELTEFLLTAKY